MSTTADRTVAASYASGGGAGLVLELEQGMCNRGAELEWLSQYPHEREVLVRVPPPTPPFRAHADTPSCVQHARRASHEPALGCAAHAPVC